MGMYPEGVVKYKCASQGYTAWWQRKLYFTFMTAYILVIPAIFMTFCYVNVVIVVWKRSRELSSFKAPTIHVDHAQTGDDVTGSGRRAEASLPVRSNSDIGSRRFFRFRSATAGSGRADVIELRPRSPETDEFSTGTGSMPSRHFRLLRRAATETECTSQLRSSEADEFKTETGNRSSMTSPRLRRAAFNVAAMSRARVRTVQMTLCIVCSFIACWTPYFTVHLIHIWSEYRYHIPEMVYVVAETLALVNSAVNPLLYAGFNASMSCCRCRRPQPDLHTDRSHISEFESPVARATGRAWRRSVGRTSTWLGQSVAGDQATSPGGRLCATAGSRGGGSSSAAVGRRCDAC